LQSDYSIIVHIHLCSVSHIALQLKSVLHRSLHHNVELISLKQSDQ